MLHPGNLLKIRGQRQCRNVKNNRTPCRFPKGLALCHAALPAIGANVITFKSTALGTAMSVAREYPVGIAAAPAFSLLRLSALARCGGAMVVIAGLWAIVFWALA
jgi:hypothetical protein